MLKSILNKLLKGSTKNKNSINTKLLFLEKGEKDFPIPFGYKTEWLCIKADVPEEVIEKMKMDIVKECNWENGMKAIQSSPKYIFVSQNLNGYILVRGSMDISRDKIISYGRQFKELQYFASVRTGDYYEWAKVADGVLIRHFISSPEFEGFTEEYGEMTPEEMELGFSEFTTKEEWEKSDEWTEMDWDNRMSAGEENVIELAEKWGINPLFPDKDQFEPGYGIVCVREI